jgi:hypothetical protein
MRHFVLPILLLSGTLSATPASATIPLAAPVQRDLQCFMLYAMAVDHAVEQKDDKVQQGAGLGLIYFLGKLKVEAPALGLADAIRQEAETLVGNPKAKEVGQSCDSEFQTAGAEMRTLGSELTSKNNGAAPPK